MRCEMKVDDEPSRQKTEPENSAEVENIATQATKAMSSRLSSSSSGGRKKSATMQKGSSEADKLSSRAGEVTHESVESTRRMVQLVDECQDAGINTLIMLNHQGESLNRTEAALEDVNNNLTEGDSTLKNIERMEKVPCVCLPFYLLCCKCRKNKKRKTRIVKTEIIEAPPPPDNGQGLSLISPTPTAEARPSPRDTPRPDLLPHPRRPVRGLPHVATPRPDRGAEGDTFTTRASLFSGLLRPAYRERFFPVINGGIEEDEIEGNLSHLTSHLVNLRSQALQMGTTVESQNAQIDRMNVRSSIQRSRLVDINRRTSRLVNDTNGGSSSVTDPSGSDTTCPCSFSLF